jgi:hypothetical protein
MIPYSNTDVWDARCFHRILPVLAGAKGSFYHQYVQFPSASDDPSIFISSNPKFSPYFKDAIGAIDGTHIAACASASDRVRYRNRKGFLSQNVLAACTFGLRFCYVMSGWEGSAADARLWQAACESDLHMPEGKYFLADAGFGLSMALLVPYQGVRYHLREFASSTHR